MKRFVLLVCLCLLPFAAAQEDDAALSTERLAKLLLGEGEDVTLFPESLPEGLDLSLPEDVRMLGSAAIGEDRTITAFELQADWEESAETVGDMLEEAGWRAYDPFYHPEIFQEPAVDEGGPPWRYCSPDGSSEAYLNANSLPSGTLVILYTHLYCGAPSQELAPLPEIALPAGLVSQGGSMGQSGDSFQATIQYDTDLSAESLFENFAAQLTAQRWSVEEATEKGGAVSANLTLETNGETWRGLLSVTSDSAVLQVSRLQ